MFEIHSSLRQALSLSHFWGSLQRNLQPAEVTWAFQRRFYSRLSQAQQELQLGRHAFDRREPNSEGVPAQLSGTRGGHPLVTEDEFSMAPGPNFRMARNSPK